MPVVKLTDEQQAYLAKMFVEKKIEVSVCSTDPYSTDGGRNLETMPLFESWYLSRGFGPKQSDLPWLSHEPGNGYEYFIEVTAECTAPWLWEKFEVYGKVEK
jgi:hypothetical protein